MVFRASASPPGMLTVTSTSTSPPAASNARLSAIMARGPGLMAGSPGGSGRPGLVTVPTPTPARKRNPLPGGSGRRVTTISAPWVTSGSSPASLMTEAVALPPSSARAWRLRAKAGVSPRGSTISTGSGKAPVRRAVRQARAAAVAQAPVVQPLRRGRVSVMGRSYTAAPAAASVPRVAAPAHRQQKHRQRGEAHETDGGGHDAGGAVVQQPHQPSHQRPRPHLQKAEQR